MAWIIIRNIKRECADMGGTWNLNPGDDDLIDCHLDVCSAQVVCNTVSSRYANTFAFIFFSSLHLVFCKMCLLKTQLKVVNMMQL